MDQSLKDFVSEAEDILDNLEGSIMTLTELDPEDHRKPEVVNLLFRQAHSLKGLSGMLNLDRISTLSHRMESLLDDLRLDKIPLSAGVAHALSGGSQLLLRMVRAVAEGEGDEKVEITPFLDSLEALKKGGSRGGEKPLSALLAVPEGLQDILSEYEEHRFRDNVGRKVPFFTLACEMDIATFDKELKALTEAIKSRGELLTTLPKTDLSRPNGIGFLLYIATREAEGVLREALEEEGRILSPVPFKGPGAGGGGKVPAPRADEGSAEGAPREGDLPAGQPGLEDQDLLEEVKGVSNTVRVDISKLDFLMNLVGELVILKSSLSGSTGRIRGESGGRALPGLGDLEKAVLQLEKKLVELRDGVMGIRMVPVGQLFTRLQRVVKKVGREMKKRVRVEMSGTETELDKMIMEEIVSPLLHIVRNSLDHGVEEPGERVKRGKREEGTVRFSAYQQGNHVVVEVEDDGRGIDLEKVRKKALAKGLLRAEENPTEEQLFSFLFLPGFSTKDEVTLISGRGVGMDVVKRELDRIGGTVEVQSRKGHGTRVVLTLPITLAILQALLVKVGERTFAIPMGAIQETNQVSPKDLKTIEGREILNLRNRTLSLLRLERVFDLPPRPEGGPLFVVVVSMGARTMGILVTGLVGKQDIVIKPLGEAFTGTVGLAGATELGDQTTILVLDVGGLMGEAIRQGGLGKTA